MERPSPHAQRVAEYYADIEGEAEKVAESGWDKARAYRIMERAVQEEEAVPGTWPFSPVTYFSDVLLQTGCHHSKEDVLSVIEGGPPAEFLRRFEVARYCRESGIRSLSLAERAARIQDFANRLSQHQQEITQTGHPPFNYVELRRLGILARNYYTRIPEKIKCYPLPTSVEHCEMAKYEKETPFHLTSWDGDPSTVVSYLTLFNARYSYRWPSGGCKEALPLPILTEESAAELEARRGQFFRLKMIILQAAVQALRDADAEYLWNHSLDCTAQLLGRDGVRFYYEMDRLYFGSGEREDFYVPGGLINMFDFTGECECEITVGPSHRVGEALGELVEKDQAGRARLRCQNYFDLIETSKKNTFDRAVDLRDRLEAEALEFLQEHVKRVDQTLRDRFRIRGKTIQDVAPTTVSLRATGRCPALPEDDLEAAGELARRRPSIVQNVIPFAVPAGATWGNVTIEFVKEEMVKISVGSEADLRNFSNMGFVNRRRSKGPPDKLWETLKFLAQRNGSLSWEDSVDMPPHDRTKLKKLISDIRKRLRTVFPGIEGDPFLPYRKVKGYVTRFTLSWNVKD